MQALKGTPERSRADPVFHFPSFSDTHPLRAPTMKYDSRKFVDLILATTSKWANWDPPRAIKVTTLDIPVAPRLNP